MGFLYILQQALVWIITIFWVYQFVISICSLINFKDKPLIEKKNNRFMAIIPAHNEENVIENLILSLKHFPLKPLKAKRLLNIFGHILPAYP